MKRDMELAREIMLIVEDLPYDGAPQDIQINGRPSEEISYHVLLLHEAGLIEGMEFPSLEGIQWKPKRLTYQGHEFIDAARSDTVWKKAKDVVLKSSGTLTMEALKLALPHVVSKLMLAG